MILLLYCVVAAPAYKFLSPDSQTVTVLQGEDALLLCEVDKAGMNTMICMYMWIDITLSRKMQLSRGT